MYSISIRSIQPFSRVRLTFKMFLISFLVSQCYSCSTKLERLILKPQPSAKVTPPPKVITTQKTTEAPAVLSRAESEYVRYGKLAKSGFYLEIEESLDNSVKVNQIKSLPPIYSQLISNETLSKGTKSEDRALEDDLPQNDDPNATATDDESTTTAASEPDIAIAHPDWTAADRAINNDWSGDCSLRDWEYCNKLKKIVVMNVYSKIIGKNSVWQHLDLDCLIEPVVCLKNDWTVNRCHILCMSKCNKEILQGWDTFVSYEGGCKYIRK